MQMLGYSYHGDLLIPTTQCHINIFTNNYIIELLCQHFKPQDRVIVKTTKSPKGEPICRFKRLTQKLCYVILHVDLIWITQPNHRSLKDTMPTPHSKGLSFGFELKIE